MSRPMRARGLKHRSLLAKRQGPNVAPHAGAWIETNDNIDWLAKNESRPMRARGLKQKYNNKNA